MSEFGSKFRPDIILPNEPHEVRPPLAGTKADSRQGRDRTQEPSAETERPHLESIHKQYLVLEAKGATGEEIEAALSLTKPDTTSMYAMIQETLGTTSKISTIVTAIEEDILNPEAILEGIDRDAFAKLSPHQKALLDAALEGNAAEIENAAIANRLGLTEKTVKERFGRIHRKLGTKDKTGTISAYAAMKKAEPERLPSALTVELQPREKRPNLSDQEIDMLRLTAMGMRREEVGEELTVSIHRIDKIGTSINRKLRTNATLHAVLTAIDMNTLNTADILTGVDRSKIAQLTQEERQILDLIVANNGKNGANAVVGRKLKKPSRYVEDHLGSIYRKLETWTKERTAAVYVADQKEPEIEKITEKQITLANLLARGYSEKALGEHFQLSEGGIESRIKHLYRILRVNSAAEAVIVSLKYDIIDPEVVLEERSRDIIDTLNADENLILTILTTNRGEKSSNREIAKETSLSVSKINKVLASIKGKFESNNRFQSAAIFIAARKLKEREEHYDTIDE